MTRLDYLKWLRQRSVQQRAQLSHAWQGGIYDGTMLLPPLLFYMMGLLHKTKYLMEPSSTTTPLRAVHTPQCPGVARTHWFCVGRECFPEKHIPAVRVAQAGLEHWMFL